MALKEMTFFGEIDKVQIAIERLRNAYEISKTHGKGALYVAFSGGKDSVCIAELCKMASVPYELHYNVTTVDPPELLWFIRDNYPEIHWEKPTTTMWKLIPKKKMPPTRLVRYCCQELKEGGGEGRICVTGVRKAESVKRSKREAYETITKRKENKMLFNDNDEARRELEQCTLKAKIVCNPIIDWTDDDVWEFIKSNNFPYCKLYDEGWKRIGCIGCPMATVKDKEREFTRYPWFKKQYIKAFEKMLKEIPNATWKNGEEVFDWWVNGKGNQAEDKGQMHFMGEDNE